MINDGISAGNKTDHEGGAKVRCNFSLVSGRTSS